MSFFYVALLYMARNTRKNLRKKSKKQIKRNKKTLRRRTRGGGLRIGGLSSPDPTVDDVTSACSIIAQPTTSSDNFDQDISELIDSINGVDNQKLKRYIKFTIRGQAQGFYSQLFTSLNSKQHKDGITGVKRIENDTNFPNLWVGVSQYTDLVSVKFNDNIFKNKDKNKDSNPWDGISSADQNRIKVRIGTRFQAICANKPRSYFIKDGLIKNMDDQRVLNAIRGALSNLNSFKVVWNEGADTTWSINHDSTAGYANDDIAAKYEKLG